MSVTIRSGRITDLPEVLSLIKELAAYEKAADQVETTLAEMEEDGFGQSPAFEFLVAEYEQEVAGVAIFYIKYSTWKGKALYLEDFVMKEKLRRKGIGALLFEEVIKIARDRNYRRMEWQVLEWNEPALNFYKKYKASLDPEWIVGQFTYSQLQSL